jgi:predicted RecB family nuclease
MPELSTKPTAFATQHIGRKLQTLKTLAEYLGFTWRDAHPSGAAAVEWFDRWCRERDPAVKQRILEYNEDDCRATRVLLDGIRDLASDRSPT